MQCGCDLSICCLLRDWRLLGGGHTVNLQLNLSYFLWCVCVCMWFSLHATGLYFACVCVCARAAQEMEERMTRVLNHAVLGCHGTACMCVCHVFHMHVTFICTVSTLSHTHTHTIWKHTHTTSLTFIERFNSGEMKWLSRCNKSHSSKSIKSQWR